MFKTFSGALLLVLTVAAVSAYADVVLDENFDELTPAFGVTSAGAFSTINGTNVDIVFAGEPGGNFCFSPEANNCIDMNGTGGNPQGQLQSNTLFPAGQYLLSFDMIGSGRGTNASFSATFGNFNLSNIGLGPSAAVIITDVPVTLATADHLLFVSNTAGEIGVQLDNVKVVQVLAPTFTKVFGVQTITAGQTTSLAFTLTNPTGNPALGNVAFSDTLPGSLLVAAGPTTDTCGGTLIANAGTNSISLSGGALSAGPSSCTIVVPILAGSPGSAATTLTNTTSTLTSTFVKGNGVTPPGDPAVATILVIPADAAQVSYAANLKSGDSKINLTNAGTTGGIDATDSICVNVYVFAEDQQLIECCTCPLTPNDLRTLSVTNDLINNTLTLGVPVGITTMLVAVAGKRCDAANVLPTDLVAGLRAWGTTLHATPGGGFAVTETPFSKVALSPTELAKMTQFCGFIEADGTKFGICNSCSSGAAGASKK